MTDEYITISKDFEFIELNEMPRRIGVSSWASVGDKKLLIEFHHCYTPKLTSERLDEIINEAQDNLDKLIKLRDELK